jgi:hypothetical protein
MFFTFLLKPHPDELAAAVPPLLDGAPVLLPDAPAALDDVLLLELEPQPAATSAVTSRAAANRVIRMGVIPASPFQDRRLELRGRRGPGPP